MHRKRLSSQIATGVPLSFSSGGIKYLELSAFRIVSSGSMLWTIAVILLILWLLGFSFHVGGGLIHIVLVIVVIVVIVRLVSGRGI
jgi:hypothetical protein